jgi:hypothetical protein
MATGGSMMTIELYTLILSCVLVIMLLITHILEWYESRQEQKTVFLKDKEWLLMEDNVNGFGCALLTILFNAMCPLYTVGYWFVRTFKYLCTVGRVDV